MLQPKGKNHPKVVLVLLGGPGRNRPGLRMLDPPINYAAKVMASKANQAEFNVFTSNQ